MAKHADHSKAFTAWQSMQIMAKWAQHGKACKSLQSSAQHDTVYVVPSVPSKAQHSMHSMAKTGKACTATFGSQGPMDETQGPWEVGD